MAESHLHLALKLAAKKWARKEEGYQVTGSEIRVPNSNFRADAVACRMARPNKGEFVIEATAVFECKQARSDFLNDNLPEVTSRERLKTLHARREKLEKLVGGHYPDLRQGDSLFPEYQSVDPRNINHSGYQRVMNEIAMLERGIFRRTKFDRMIRYRCADVFYLVVAKGIVQPHEVPLAWGILESEKEIDPAREDDEISLKQIRKPTWNEASDKHRLEMLYHLARRGNGYEK